MERKQKITKYLSRDGRGIEIGPWFNPIVPKRDGYATLIIDVFDEETLRQRAISDPNVPAERVRDIEPVDLLGSSSELEALVERAGLLGQMDFIVSSHNVEHIPDLLKFLQGCAKVLKDGGTLSMAVPDKRGCFDYFRPNSSLADVLEANQQHRSKPSFGQMFEHESLYAKQYLDGKPTSGFSTGVDPMSIFPSGDLKHVYDVWRSRLAQSPDQYFDVHCWVFTPASFERLVSELSFLGLIELELIEVEAGAGEFYVHLRHNSSHSRQAPEVFAKRRIELLRREQDEACVASLRYSVMLGTTQGRVGEEDERLTLLRSELDVLMQERALLKSAVEEYRQSTSWRITAPLRALASRGRRMLAGRHG
ncbi:MULTISPECIES: methyltransferase domain-containing protein [Pseudomonas]|uniref:methyltransferase domain-containing protein n=1 Tax=Pseudomonas TaxID=286 RepID=UPI0004D69E05|nr:MULTISPECIES: methyltransferase domain-containing protein [unclassified Pseudomonas]KES24572.1 hypothetical protein FG99_08290 [Pseudomonas sp. AAC]MBH3431407.1 methyltransferase domain-containing protein [Pseudomonas citronellolis]OHR90536.1 hypothetical protein HMPREF3289_21505 [Pseudomonas sp. HMSC75E02]